MKKFIMVATPFFLLLLVIGLSVTYALFESRKKVDTEVDIAKWQVKINKSQIEGYNSTLLIDKVNWNTSPYVKEGLAAPGVTGYFDIEIDPNMNDTSIRYDIKYDFSRLNSKQFIIESIEEIDSKVIVRTDKYTYSNIMLLNSADTNTIRVVVVWVNDEDNNVIDSNLGLQLNNKIQIPVVVTITQHEEGEELIEYLEP